MSFFNRLTAVLLTALLIAPTLPLEARTRKGDRFLGEGRTHEDKKEWDAALEAYEKAMSEDPADISYEMAVQKARFQTAQFHLDKGLRLRAQGQLGDALLEFQRAYGVNPASTAAEQEIRRTQEMIQRERAKALATGHEAPLAEQALTPVQTAKKETQDRIASMLPLPELKPLKAEPINLKMNNQKPKVLFETVCKVAGINLLMDPEYTEGKNQSIELNGTTLDEALDYLAVITKSYWKPMSANTIFVTNDNVTKRRDYEDQVTKVFYLSNVNSPQELQEIVTAIRSVADIQRLFVYNSQNAIIARGEADRIALAEKIIADLDKPKAEVVVDIIVMEASSVYSRKLTAAIASTGLNVPASFTPRSSIVRGVQTSSGSNSGTGTGTSTTTTSTAIPTSAIGKVNFSDYSVILPDAMLQAVLSDAKTKVLQSPQLRSVDNQKATLKIGDRQPTASGSYSPGVGGVGINALVNTQFTYIDVGVNVDLTPRVHENGEVSMHVEVEISSVNGKVNLGGIDQPIIGQRKVIHDLRLREGEINLMGGLVNQQDSKTKTGVPGLSNVPLLGRLFSGEEVDHNRNELMIALIPHIVRRPEITPENLRSIAVGNATVVKLNYAPRKVAEAPAAVPAPAPAPATAAPTTAVPPAVAPARPSPAETPGMPAMPQPLPNGVPVGPPASITPGPRPNILPGIPLGGVPVAPGQAGPPPLPGPVQPPATPPAIPPDPSASAAQPGSRAVVSFTPNMMETQVSGGVAASLMLADGVDVFAAPLQIQFDPKVLRLTDVARGTLLGNDGQQVVFTKNIMNDTGIATVNLNRFPGNKGVNGAGTLVTMSFQAVGKGNTQVTVPNLTVRDSQGNTIFSGSPTLTVTVK